MTTTTSQASRRRRQHHQQGRKQSYKVCITFYGDEGQHFDVHVILPLLIILVIEQDDDDDNDFIYVFQLRLAPTTTSDDDNDDDDDDREGQAPRRVRRCQDHIPTVSDHLCWLGMAGGIHLPGSNIREVVKEGEELGKGGGGWGGV